MGFFGALGKILAGKPVYGPEAGTSTSAGSRGVQPGAGQPENKMVPVVRLGRIKAEPNDGHTEVWADVRNESSVPVRIKRIHLLGATRELNEDVRPGDTRELLLYKGPSPQNDAARTADVEYCNEAGNYFSAHHEVRYHQEPNGQWEVSEFILRLPIQDLPY
ncbi:MAG TPA: hypothetical protein VLF69_04170 [Candidatus Saccharimonadales bacterium]|nr:hypothetical protein [Candidatus Saccharimonadales bacterium]